LSDVKRWPDEADVTDGTGELSEVAASLEGYAEERVHGIAD
jgi:hypothetical protein